MSTSTSENPTFSYPDIGVYPVSLTVSLPNGQTATVRRRIVIFELITTAFTYEAEPCLDVAFTDTSSVSGTIVSWAWTFGDGGVSSLQNPTHTYMTEDTFTVTLTIRTDGGGIGIVNHDVDVVITDTVVAEFSSDIDVGEVTFTDESTADSSIVAWEWDFGDSLGTSTDQNPVYTYATNDTYTVSLTVTSDCGIEDVITHDVVIADIPVPVPLIRKGAKTVGFAGRQSSPSKNVLITTSNFDSGSPTWTTTDITTATGGTGHIISKIVADPFSDYYKGIGSQVDAWVLANGIYRITDVFGTPSVSAQYTSATYFINTGQLYADPNVEGTVFGIGIDSSTTPFHHPVIILSTDSGATWTVYDQSSVASLIYNGNNTVYQSLSTAGLVLLVDEDLSSITWGYSISTDSGQSFGTVTAFPISGDSFTNITAAAYDADTETDILYGGVATTAGEVTFKSGTDVSPVDADYSFKYAASSFSGVPGSGVIFLVGAGGGALGHLRTAIFYSTDGGSTWTLVDKIDVTGILNFTTILQAQDDNETYYVWGAHGLWYAEAYGTANSKFSSGGFGATPVGLVIGHD